MSKKIAIFVDLDHTLINKIGRSNKGREMEALSNYFNIISEEEKLNLLREIDRRMVAHSFSIGEKSFRVGSIIRPNGIALLEALRAIPNADMFILSHGATGHIESAVDAFNIRRFFDGVYASRSENINLPDKYDIGILIDDKYDPSNPNSPRNKRKRDNDSINKKHFLMSNHSDVIEHIRVPPYDIFDIDNNVELITSDKLVVSEVISVINMIISD